jgi:mono/diheme cytochrome c family protein
MISENTRLRCACALTMSTALSLLPFAAHAQVTGPSASEPALSQGFRFVEMSGEELFASVCRGCHMADGKGAAGAATYPSLAANRNLQASGYPVTVVVKGQRGMPPFGSLMSDDQVAAVVNYLRTHFGNNYQDAVTVEDVNVARR